jgi:beta-carotene 15,15'-dioxygenase
MNKITIHQLCVILFSLSLLTISALDLDILILDNGNKGLILIALVLIGSVGLSHGAMDGKVIWEASNDALVRARIYLLYMLLCILGAVIWYLIPLAGLMILLTMSVFHFAESDLYSFDFLGAIPKLSWGITVTFMPVLFFKNDVAQIFLILTNYNTPTTVMNIIQAITAISGGIFFYTMLTSFSVKKGLILLEMISLMVISIFLHPLAWFAVYFCGAHGIRAMLNIEFSWATDIFWLLGFSIPIIITIYFLAGSTLEVEIKDLLIVFPVIACLTISHMSLNHLIQMVKKAK